MRAAQRNNYKRGGSRRRARRLRQRRFVFADEAAVNTAMTRRYGRAPGGERAVDSAPRNYGTHASVVGAMGLRGPAATPAVEGAVGTLCFDAYAERVLPLRLRPGNVVVLDDLRARWASRIEEVARSGGAQAPWLAPYSPDFGPTGQCRSKIKAYLRGAPSRRADEHNKALAQANGLVTGAEIRGWFKHCGYSLARE
jgi:transposase